MKKILFLVLEFQVELIYILGVDVWNPLSSFLLSISVFLWLEFEYFLSIDDEVDGCKLL